MVKLIGNQRLVNLRCDSRVLVNQLNSHTQLPSTRSLKALIHSFVFHSSSREHRFVVVLRINCVADRLSLSLAMCLVSVSQNTVSPTGGVWIIGDTPQNKL